MSHHVARLIEDADRAREFDAPDAADRAADARNAILRLPRAVRQERQPWSVEGRGLIVQPGRSETKLG
jgi:hypothetical protein